MQNQAILFNVKVLDMRRFIIPRLSSATGYLKYSWNEYDLQLIVITTVIHACRFLERFLSLTVREIEQAERADRINETKSCQLVDQARSQQHNRHVDTNHCAIGICQNRR